MVVSGWAPRLPGLDLVRSSSKHAWELLGSDDLQHNVSFDPRYVVDDMYALGRAAVDGVGVVQLADYLVADQIAWGELEPVLPDWHLRSSIVHAVFPTRRGLSPAVRSFVDYLAAALKQ